MNMSLRLPEFDDPLTVTEQQELEKRLGLLLSSKQQSFHLLRMEVENFARQTVTLAFYRDLIAYQRDLVTVDAELPKRVVVNGIAYLEIRDAQVQRFDDDEPHFGDSSDLE